MKTKICTSIEQSKKLIELGIPKNTADMCWSYLSNKGEYADIPCVIPVTPYVFITDIPAWSLSALLSILPIINESTYEMHGTLDGGAIITHEELTCVAYQADNPLDAVFELVVWLKENGKI